MVSGAQDSSPGTERCARCGEAFRCGAAAGEAECWCYAAPAVAPDPAAESCLCPRCLRAAARPPDVGGVALDLAAEEIVAAVRAGRTRE